MHIPRVRTCLLRLTRQRNCFLPNVLARYLRTYMHALYNNAFSRTNGAALSLA